MAQLNKFRVRGAAKTPVGLAAAALTFTLGGCGEAASDTAQRPPARPPAAGEPAFLTPPQITVARRQSNGEIDLAGRAPAGSLVRLASPEGLQLTATAAGDGGWRMTLPGADAPRLYALSAALGARTLRGEGAVATSPAPASAALLLRAGAPSLPLDGGASGLVLEAADFDGAGGLAAAGAAPANAPLRLSLDGRPAAVGQADATGRFGLLAVQGDLKPGLRDLRLEAGGAAVQRTVDATPAAPPPGKAFSTRRVAAGWRIDWVIPGSGAQSTIVFDRPPAGAGR